MPRQDSSRTLLVSVEANVQAFAPLSRTATAGSSQKTTRNFPNIEGMEVAVQQACAVVCGANECSEFAVRRMCCSVLHWAQLAQGSAETSDAYIARHDALETAAPRVRDVFDFSAVVLAKLRHVRSCLQPLYPEADLRPPPYLRDRLLADIVQLVNEQATLHSLCGAPIENELTARARAAVVAAYKPQDPPRTQFTLVNGHVVMSVFDNDNARMTEKRCELPYAWFRAKTAWSAVLQ